MKKIRQNSKDSRLLAGNIVTLLFYEPSSRSFGSFCAATKQLGGKTIEIQDPQTVASVAKGETLQDTIRVFESYSDAIVLRHPEKGSLQKAADAAFFVPVISAGDGTGEHPTQALYDLYTIYEKLKRLDGLTVVFGGDILYGRTIHSLIRGLALFKGNKAFLLSPKELKLSKEDFADFSKREVELVEIDSEKDIPKNANVWYWTRVQKERFSSLRVYKKVKNRFIVTKQLLDRYGNKSMILMHPLPRMGEITTDVDNDSRSVYLRSQIRNGMYVRMALLALVLGRIS